MANFEYTVVGTESDSGHTYFRIKDGEEWQYGFAKDSMGLMLDTMGAEGWILCGILSSFDQDIRYIFKRPVAGATPMEYCVFDEEHGGSPDKLAYLLCSPGGQPFYEGELNEHDRRQSDFFTQRYGQDWEFCFAYISHSFGNIYHGDGISNEKIFILMRPQKMNAESRKVG